MGEMPVHSHNNLLTDPGHSHSFTQYGSLTAFVQGGSGGWVNTSAGTTGTSSTGITISNANAGSGNAHTILSPAMTLPFILRVI
jgi:hypothetical protein